MYQHSQVYVVEVMFSLLLLGTVLSQSLLAMFILLVTDVYSPPHISVLFFFLRIFSIFVLLMFLRSYSQNSSLLLLMFVATYIFPGPLHLLPGHPSLPWHTLVLQEGKGDERGRRLSHWGGESCKGGSRWKDQEREEWDFKREVKSEEEANSEWVQRRRQLVIFHAPILYSRCSALSFCSPIIPLPTNPSIVFSPIPNLWLKRDTGRRVHAQRLT